MSVTSSNPQDETVAPALPTFARMGERRFGSFNLLGLWTLYCKEVRRFAKESAETIVAPVLASLLFLFVFVYAFGENRPSIGNVPLINFLIPGLAMMSLIQNAFGNISFSLLHSKIMGDVVDFIMAPLSPGELTLAFVAGAATCGIVVAFCVLFTMVVFHPLPIVNLWAVLFFGIGASLLLGQLGLLTGLWSERYDHLQSVVNLIITPLSFLSGTFYPITVLPQAVQIFNHGNPFFYLIDGFRYGFIGYAESNILAGVVMVALLNLILWVLCYLALRSGWRLKS